MFYITFPLQICVQNKGKKDFIHDSFSFFSTNSKKKEEGM